MVFFEARALTSGGLQFSEHAGFPPKSRARGPLLWGLDSEETGCVGRTPPVNCLQGGNKRPRRI